MTSNATNPALLAAATGLGNVVSHQVIDIRVDTASTFDIQRLFVERRTRLGRDLSRVVAALAFEGAS